MKGFLKVPRSFFEDYAFREERIYSHSEAMLDLQQIAALAPTRRLSNGKLIHLKIGELVASERYLQNRWSWSRTKVRNFIKIQVKNGWLKQRKDQQETVLILLEYWGYELTTDRKKTTNQTKVEPPRDQRRTKEGERRERKELKNVAKATMSSSPNDLEAKELLGYLNERSGHSYRPIETHLEAIRNRLDEPGVTPDGVRQMIDAKCSEWKADAKMNQYLRPQTLFARSKFAGYYDTRQTRRINGITTEEDHERGF